MKLILVVHRLQYVNNVRLEDHTSHDDLVQNVLRRVNNDGR